MSPLERQIRQSITINGPMSIETFMGLAISHYYATRDPFGADGDFTTAPEISQMFGEMIGVWISDAWVKLGQPSEFILVEGGPGRGTLMTDILRATGKMLGFREGMSLHLIETSPVLRNIQKATLAGYNPVWHDSLETLPELPMIFIANELLDAMPVRQYECRKGRWYERVVGLEGDRLVFGLREAQVNAPVLEGSFREESPAIQSFIKSLSDRIRRNRGAALLIDYGYDMPGASGDTLQAVKSHQFVPVLENIGEADLTAHIDFYAVKECCDVAVSGPVGQGDFLNALGMDVRLQMLKLRATPQQYLDLQSAYSRLTSPTQMGKLFRAMAMCHDPEIKLSGF